jgi:hypothetical protein
MAALAKGIAHVSFAGGGIFLPAGNRYDRETLMEYVADNVRTKGQVQILVDDQRWLARDVRPESGGGCSTCRGRLLGAACYAAADVRTAYCVKCAFAPCVRSRSPGNERQQRPS